MKSPNALLPATFTAMALATAVATLLTGCGQTGPLYMPKPPAKPAAQSPAIPAKPVTPTPVPASTR